METLNRFDDLLDRFGKISISGGGEPEEGGPGIAFTSFTGKSIPTELNSVVLDLQEKFEKTGETQSALTPQGFVKIEATAPNRLGILGGPDMTPRISYNEKLTIKSNEQAVDNATALFTAANLPATLSPLVSGRGAVQPRVVTKPNYTNPGVRPTVPPIVRDPKVKLLKKKMTHHGNAIAYIDNLVGIYLKVKHLLEVRTRELLKSEPGSKSPTTPKANQAEVRSRQK